MKLSDLILQGYAKVGRQCRYVMCEGDPSAPTAVCVIGAAYFARTGQADSFNVSVFDMEVHAYKILGVRLATMNDEGLCIEDIVGILQAEGL